MTKADLIDLIAERTKLPHGRAELLICQMFDAMVDALRKGEGIEIRGFGSFSIRAYKEYQGRNPRTGEAVHVRPKRLAFFKVGKELRERVNSGARGKRSVPETTPTPTSAASGSEERTPLPNPLPADGARGSDLDLPPSPACGRGSG
jgi:integration host factor subunit beta